MHACEIRQYLIRQNMLCTISPNITLANIPSYTLCNNLTFTFPRTLLLIKAKCNTIVCMKLSLIKPGAHCVAGVPLVS